MRAKIWNPLNCSSEPFFLPHLLFWACISRCDYYNPSRRYTLPWGVCGPANWRNAYFRPSSQSYHPSNVGIAFARAIHRTLIQLNLFLLAVETEILDLPSGGGIDGLKPSLWAERKFDHFNATPMHPLNLYPYAGNSYMYQDGVCSSTQHVTSCLNLDGKNLKLVSSSTSSHRLLSPSITVLVSSCLCCLASERMLNSKPKGRDSVLGTRKLKR